MIAGRLRWRERGAAIPGKVGLAAFDFPTGTRILTEAGSKRQASIHIVRGADAVAALDPGGLEVLDADLPAFAARLTRDNHTLKRALTDPHIFSGIGNAYSDEILHAAQLSPMKLTSALERRGDRDAVPTRRASTLLDWIARLRDEAGGEFPEKVTAFREGHGRPRPLRPAVPGLRRAGPAHRLRDERGELLQPLPDRRPAAVGSGAVAAAQGGLAAHAGRAGVAPGRTAGNEPVRRRLYAFQGMDGRHS